MTEKKEDASTKAPPTSHDGNIPTKDTNSKSENPSAAAASSRNATNNMSNSEPSKTPPPGATQTGSSNDKHQGPDQVAQMAANSKRDIVAPATLTAEAATRAEKNDSGEGSSSTVSTGKSGTDQSSNSLASMTAAGCSSIDGKPATMGTQTSAQSTSLPNASSQAPAVATNRPQNTSGSLASSTSSSNPNQSIQPPPAKRLKTESSQQAAPSTAASILAQAHPQSVTQGKTAPTLSSMMNHTMNKSTAQKAPASVATSHPRQPSGPGTQSARFSLFDMTPEITAMQKTIQQLLGLLHSYGPLTAGQLEYNLPVQGVSLGQERINFHDILQVLVALNLVQQQKPLSQSSSDGDGTAPSSDAPDEATLYCVNQGIPRLDTALLPQQVLDQISHAHEEISNSQKRVQRLTQLLAAQQQQQQHLYGTTRPHESTSTTTPPTPASVKHKDILRQIVMEYPEVLQDPVYVTALKNLHVDNVLAGGSDSTVPAVRPKRTSASTTTAASSTKATPGSTNPRASTTATTAAVPAKTIHAPQPAQTTAVSRVAAQAAATASTLVAQQPPPSQALASTVAVAPVVSGTTPAATSTTAISANKSAPAAAAKAPPDNADAK